MDVELKIEYIPVGDLTPYEKNARRHGQEDIRVIKNSIQENGFCDPIGIWGKQNLIVEGHGRLIAAKELGLETVPCIRLDHLSAAQRREYALTHNKSAELSAWDFATLEEELSALDGLFDMSDFGFELNLAGAFSPEEQAEESPDSFKEYGENMPTKHVCPKCGYEWN